MSQDREHLQSACDLSLRCRWPCRALFFFPTTLYNGRRHLHICRAARHSETRRRLAARISWLDFCCARLGVVPNRNSNGDLYSDRRAIDRAPQTLFVRPRDGLHRMPLHSVRNNSRSVYDRCAFARISAGIPFSKAPVQGNGAKKLKGLARTR